MPEDVQKVTAIKMRSNTACLELKFFLNCFVFLLLTFTACFAQPDSLARARTFSDPRFYPLNTMSCTGSLGDPIVNITFGSGANYGAALDYKVTSLQYLANGCPNDGQYTITNYTSNCFGNLWHTVTDHTGDPNGYFMLVNASYDPSIFYVQQVDGLCSGTTYEFSAWIVNVMRPQSIFPNITFSIEKTDGTVLQSYNTGDIFTTGTPEWKQYGMFFTMPIGVNSVVIRMKNNAPGGFGNDLGLDDIAFRPAGPSTIISASIPGDSINVCKSSISFTSAIESCYLANQYQWQVSVNNGAWKSITGATSTSYTVAAQPAGKYKYRLIVSAAGNIGISNCRVNSNVITVVVVPEATVRNENAVICNGQSYSLPSGKKLSTGGSYSDTVRYAFGCDSLITHLQLAVQSPVLKSNDVTICQGETYTLPSGKNISSAGVYHDTARYNGTGCDSVVTKINLFVRPVLVKDSFVIICKGDVITLPWGQTVSKAGVYSDTTKYVAGCDSLVKNVHVHVTVPVVQAIEKFICPLETYTLPSGTVVNTSGFYKDTLRTAIGCDSIITLLTLNAAPPPTIHLTKSNDVNCVLGVSKLNATGGIKYVWSPAETLNNPYIQSPVASPSTNITYTVTVTTALGCVGEDSITVNFSSALKDDIQIPNAFTPNGDGRNDCFGVRFLGQVSNLKLSVYDRWGNRVFYANNPNQCWDGRYKGKAQATGVFIYYVTATTSCGEIVRKGTVTLFR